MLCLIPLFIPLVFASEDVDYSDLPREMFKDVNFVRSKGDFIHGQAAIGWTEDTGYGLYATSNVTGGSQIMRFALPPEESVIISMRTIETGYPEFFFDAEIANLRDTAVDGEYLIMSLFLLFEVQKTEESYWFPHLRLLKDVEVLNALVYTDQDLEWLQTSHVAQTIIDHQYAVQDAFEALSTESDLSGLLTHFSLESFIWAINIVNTRSIRIQTLNHETSEWNDELSIVPILDFCNFSPLGDPYNVECFTNDESTRFICRARYDIWPKEQFLLSLPAGLVDAGNAGLVADHGYLDFSTPMKEAGSTISIGNLTPKEPNRHQIAIDVFGDTLESFEALDFWIVQGRDLDDLLPSNLMVLARIEALTDDEVLLYFNSQSNDKATMSLVLSERRELNIDNEILALEVVGKAVERRYLSYYTSLPQDYSLMDKLKASKFICTLDAISAYSSTRSDYLAVFLTKQELQAVEWPAAIGVCELEGEEITRIQQLGLHYRMEEKHLLQRIVTLLLDRTSLLREAKTTGNTNIFKQAVVDGEIGPVY